MGSSTKKVNRLIVSHSSKPTAKCADSSVVAESIDVVEECREDFLSQIVRVTRLKFETSQPVRDERLIDFRQLGPRVLRASADFLQQCNSRVHDELIGPVTGHKRVNAKPKLKRRKNRNLVA